MAITALTPERRRMIQAAYDRGLEIGRSTAPADFDAAEAAIAKLYAMTGQKKPHFVRLSSPLAAELYLNLLTATWPAATQATSRNLIYDQLYDQLGGQLGGQLRDQLYDQLRGQLGGQLRGQLYDQLRGQLYGQLGGQLRDQLRDQLYDQLYGQLRDQLGGQLYGQLRDQLGGQLRDQLYDQLRGQLGGQLGGQLYGQPLRYFGTWCWGSWDWYWLFIDGGRQVGAVYDAARSEMLDAHLVAMRSIGWWYPFNDFCILTDRPEALHVDERGRLHNPDGAALRYRDGYGLWALNGLRVASQIVEAPETLTRDQVRDEPNTELRRHMLDRYAGLRGSAAAGRWLRDMEAKPVDVEDITAKMQPSGLAIWRLAHGDEPVLCKLYVALMADDEPMHLLFVVCTSTAKEVFLRVPPFKDNRRRVPNLDAAWSRAWTFPGAKLEAAVET